MASLRKIIIKILIASIAFLLIDGGRTLNLAGSRIHFIIEQKHNRDIEVPDHIDLNKLVNHEKWLPSENQNILFSSGKAKIISVSQQMTGIDYSRTIWQPPRAA